jgi:DNA polymerase-3 subunit gamma/tau
LRILQLHQRISIDFLVRRLQELEKSAGNLPNTNSSLTTPIVHEQQSLANISLPFDVKPQPTKVLSPAEEVLKPIVQEIPIVPTTPAPTSSSSSKPTPAPYSMTEDPTPTLADIGKKKSSTKPKSTTVSIPVPTITEPPIPSFTEPPALEEVVAKPMASDASTHPSSIHSATSPENAISSIKKQSRYDTLLQFAAVELEGALQKKPMGGY